MKGSTRFWLSLSGGFIFIFLLGAIFMWVISDRQIAQPEVKIISQSGDVEKYVDSLIDKWSEEKMHLEENIAESDKRTQEKQDIIASYQDLSNELCILTGTRGFGGGNTCMIDNNAFINIDKSVSLYLDREREKIKKDNEEKLSKIMVLIEEQPKTFYCFHKSNLGVNTPSLFHFVVETTKIINETVQEPISVAYNHTEYELVNESNNTYMPVTKQSNILEFVNKTVEKEIKYNESFVADGRFKGDLCWFTTVDVDFKGYEPEQIIKMLESLEQSDCFLNEREANLACKSDGIVSVESYPVSSSNLSNCFSFCHKTCSSENCDGLAMGLGLEGCLNVCKSMYDLSNNFCVQQDLICKANLQMKCGPETPCYQEGTDTCAAKFNECTKIYVETMTWNGGGAN